MFECVNEIGHDRYHLIHQKDTYMFKIWAAKTSLGQVKCTVY